MWRVYWCHQPPLAFKKNASLRHFFRVCRVVLFILYIYAMDKNSKNQLYFAHLNLN